MIELENYEVVFPLKKLYIEKLSFPEKGLLLLTGDNGSGKTTLIRSILNIHKNYGGNIYIDGLNNKAIKRREIAKKISYLPQLTNFSFSISVKDFIDHISYSSNPKFMEDVLDILMLKEYLSRDIMELSGGEKQLAKIARAFVPDVKYTILDEPDTFLSRKNREKLINLIKYFSNKRVIIIVSHSTKDFEFVENIIDIEKFLVPLE